MNMNRLFGLLALFVLLPLSRSHSQTTPRIDFFSPQDTVKNVRQVAVRFSDQMVPFGSPKVTTEIFDVDCPERVRPVGPMKETGSTILIGTCRPVCAANSV